MGYKTKPNKAAGKRLRVTKTGKLKRNHSLTSHLRSARTSAKKRRLRRPALVAEGIARNVRRAMVMEGRRPNKIRHDREVAAKRAAVESDKK